jgi:hypothetical protein
MTHREHDYVDRLITRAETAEQMHRMVTATLDSVTENRREWIDRAEEARQTIAAMERRAVEVQAEHDRERHEEQVATERVWEVNRQYLRERDEARAEVARVEQEAREVSEHDRRECAAMRAVVDAARKVLPEYRTGPLLGTLAKLRAALDGHPEEG